MPRLLVVGKRVPRLKSIEWAEWRNHNLLDYQGLLIDCRNLSRISGGPELSNLLQEYMRHGHTVFLILPEASEISANGWDLVLLPCMTLHLTPESGRTLKNSSGSVFFQMYMEALQGHKLVIAPRQTVQHLPHGWAWQVSVSDNVNRAVCAQFARAYILHPPAPGRDAIAEKAIFEFFKPDFEEPEPEQSPEWSARVASSVPGVEDILNRKERAVSEIARLQALVDRDTVEQQKLERWAEMLWLDGVALQDRVSEALALLGIPNESKDPTGHTQDLQGICENAPLLFEVAGSNGSIGVDKGRQLLQWLAQCPDPARTKGVLVANAFRNLAPENRPPSPNHRVFVKELEEMAVRFHFALLDVRDLFEAVVAKLRGDAVSVAAIGTALRGDGVVKLAVPAKSAGADSA